jgi:diguanylate cyclase (GGDEF)-like protein
MPALSPSKWIFALLGAAILSLACAIIGVFVAREHLVEANEWVRHTSEVQLSIGSCRLQIRQAQLEARERPVVLASARADAEHIRVLTADNPPQQARAKALIPLLLAFAGDRAEADRIDLGLREMAIVEGALMDVRMTVLERARRTGWLVISVSSFLTVVLIAIMLGTLYRQSRALASAHLKIRQEGAMLASIIDSMVDGIMAITPQRAFLHVNRAARRLLGDSFPEKSFPKDWRSTIECRYQDGSEMKPEDGALARAIAGQSTDNLVYRTRQIGDPTDAGTWISATARPVRDGDGTVIAGVVALRDISEQKRQQDQLHAMSMLDELTGLRNRRGFLMLAEQHARVAQRHAIPFGIVFVDLNGLKAINDSLGHEAGDQTIRAAGDVLRETFRESDILARLGGDEFVVLLANADPGMQGAIAARLEDGVSAHNARLALPRRLSLSVGIAFFDPRQPLPLGELMVEADRLMYADKRERRRLGA